MITGNVSKNQSLIQEIQETEEITKSSPERRTPPPSATRWQKILANAVRDPVELLQLLQLDTGRLKKQHYNPQHFPLRVPRGFIQKMKPGNWSDPLLMQVLPLHAETNLTDGYQRDPVNDLQAISQPGMLQKYAGRALIITTGACAIHCRYCFRQHFPYAEQHNSHHEWHATITQLKADDSIHEVILSGGDPLALSDQRLQSLATQIADIPHIHTLRLHTRLPLVLPERIDASFIQWFSALPIQKVMVIHANHANEFCDMTKVALTQLRQCDTLLFNQSVLLKGINDNAKALIDLSHILLAHQVTPYYLHLLDHVQGAAHFDVSEAQALVLMQQLRHALPGYLVPKLVREISGRRSKSPIN